MPGGDNSNGQRVTMALLGQKLDALADAFRQSAAETREYRRQMEDRLRAVEQEQARFREQARNNRDDITELRSHSNRWDMLVSAFSALGATIAGLLGGRQ